MKICLYWYSATGNTMSLARACMDEWALSGHEATAFDMLNRKNLPVPQPDDFDAVVFAFPVMVFRPPEVARRFVEALAAQKKGVPAHMLITSGGMGGKTDSVFAGLLAEKGMIPAGAVELVCQDSYIPFRKYLWFLEKKGLPDEGTREAAARFAAKVASGSEAEAREPWSGCTRSFFAWIGKNAPPEAAKQLLGPRRLESDRCDGCGLCVKLCPVHAIHMLEKTPLVEEELCIGCLACFNNCRSGAWRLKRFGLKHHYRLEGESVWKDL